VQREIKILADLGDGHLNIVHADEVLLTKTHVGLVMEYVSGEGRGQGFTEVYTCYLALSKACRALDLGLGCTVQQLVMVHVGLVMENVSGGWSGLCPGLI
jgi:hypothetical protein